MFENKREQVSLSSSLIESMLQSYSLSLHYRSKLDEYRKVSKCINAKPLCIFEGNYSQLYYYAFVLQSTVVYLYCKCLVRQKKVLAAYQKKNTACHCGLIRALASLQDVSFSTVYNVKKENKTRENAIFYQTFHIFLELE